MYIYIYCIAYPLHIHMLLLMYIIIVFKGFLMFTHMYTCSNRGAIAPASCMGGCGPQLESDPAARMGRGLLSQSQYMLRMVPTNVSAVLCHMGVSLPVFEQRKMMRLMKLRVVQVAGSEFLNFSFRVHYFRNAIATTTNYY